MKKTVIHSNDAPDAIGPYSQAIRVGDWLYCSGQLPKDMKTGKLEITDIKRATALALDNLNSVCVAAGGSIKDAVKVTIFVTDLANFADINEVYATYFDDTPPARACVQVSALPAGATIEMDLVAYLG